VRGMVKIKRVFQLVMEIISIKSGQRTIKQYLKEPSKYLM
jgi:hypothetical protein